MGSPELWFPYSVKRGKRTKKNRHPRTEIDKPMNVLHEAILQDGIQAILEDWDPNEVEEAQLDFIRHRLNQRFPNSDVSATDVRRIMNEPNFPTDPEGFDPSEVLGFLFEDPISNDDPFPHPDYL